MNYIVKYYGKNPRVAYDGSIMSDEFDRYYSISLNRLKHDIEEVYHPVTVLRYNPKSKNPSKLERVYIVRYEIWKADEACYKTLDDKPVYESKLK